MRCAHLHRSFVLLTSFFGCCDFISASVGMLRSSKVSPSAKALSTPAVNEMRNVDVRLAVVAQIEFIKIIRRAADPCRDKSSSPQENSLARGSRSKRSENVAIVSEAVDSDAADG